MDCVVLDSKPAGTPEAKGNAYTAEEPRIGVPENTVQDKDHLGLQRPIESSCGLLRLV